MGRGQGHETIIEFQNARFELATMKTKLQVGSAHLDHCLKRHLAGELTAAEGAAAKLWHTELQWEIVGRTI